MIQWHKRKIKLWNKLLVIFLTLLSSTFFWVRRTWPRLQIEELIFQLKTSITGTDSKIILSAVYSILLPTIIVFVLYYIILHLIKTKKTNTIFNVGFIVISVGINIGSLIYLNKTLDTVSYVVNKTKTSTFVDSNYVETTKEKLTYPQNKRNLIYIYCESMEDTYADSTCGGAFQDNYIPNLTQLALSNECFGDGYTLNGAVPTKGNTWTMGSVFSQSTGLPLILNIGANDMNTQSDFMPQIKGIGNVLEDAGYTNEMIMGSDKTFSGLDLFLESHGNYNVLDYNEAINRGLISKSYYEWWGYEDNKVFDYAKDELAKLSSSGQPFNLSLMTLDTHFENGYVCKDCENIFNDQYANVIHCSDKKIYEFVNWIKEQDFYENTTIVITGDHLTMDSDFCNDVSKDYTRKTYMCIINGAANRTSTKARKYTTLDVYPTVVAALGIEIDGDKLGLGVNLYSNKKTLLELNGLQYINTEFSKRSELFTHMNEGIVEQK